MTPIADTTSAASTASGSAMSKLSGNFDTFLTLLTTQLKNQDPTAPMDSNQFTQQLVQFSQVEQQIQTNSNLNSLLAQGSSMSAAYATSYLGKVVSVTNGQASLHDGAANWTYSLGSPSANTVLSITDAGGKMVYAGLGETGQGGHTFAWDGKDNNGNTLPDGAYKLTVTARDTGGNAVTPAVASAGTVTQIDMTGGTPRLVIGNMDAAIADVAAVGN